MAIFIRTDRDVMALRRNDILRNYNEKASLRSSCINSIHLRHINVAVVEITSSSSRSLWFAAGTMVRCHYRFGFLSMTANTNIAHS